MTWNKKGKLKMIKSKMIKRKRKNPNTKRREKTLPVIQIDNSKINMVSIISLLIFLNILINLTLKYILRIKTLTS